MSPVELDDGLEMRSAHFRESVYVRFAAINGYVLRASQADASQSIFAVASGGKVETAAFHSSHG
jgi:prophage maintenance system killer protein